MASRRRRRSRRPAQRPTSTFRGGVNLILVDVDVRDKIGQPLKGLKQRTSRSSRTASRRRSVTFAYEEITAKAAAVQSATMLSTAGAEKGAVPVTVAAPKPAAQPATPPPRRRRQAGRRGCSERPAHDR